MGARIDYAYIFENAPEVAILLDDAGYVLAASRCYLHGVGLEREQVVGALLRELPPYRAAPQSTACLTRALKVLRGHGVMAPHDLPDAVPCISGAHWRRATNAPIRDSEGRTICIRHELRTAPEAQESEGSCERELRKMFEHAAEAIALVDAEGRFTFVTPSIRHVLGYSEAEFIGAPPASLVHPNDAQRFGDELKQVYMRPSALMMVRFRALHRDGRYRTLECTNNNRLHDPDVSAVIVTFRDVSVQVALQEELRRSHEQLRLALSAAQARPWTWDPGRKTFAYHAVSGEAAGESSVPQGLTASAPPETFQPAAPDEVRQYAAKCLTSGEAFCADFSDGPVNGSERWYRCAGRAFQEAPEGPLRLLGITWDITDRRRLEKEREAIERRMQESQKLESLGVLAGGIAHDFNNILMSILGNASLVQTAVSGDAKVLPFVSQIEEGARRAAELCRQMLAYAGKGRFVLTYCQLNSLVESTTHLLQVSISKNVVLRIHLQAGLPSVLADATQLRQVLMNFVINASDAIGERSGVISVFTGVVRADRAYLDATLLSPQITEGDYVYLEVSDTGDGMSAETRARIFDPFYTTKFTGRGLGLAAVLGIVRGHKGAIKVYSELGKGSSFKILLPATLQVAAESPSNPALPKLHAGGTILLVDDEETVIAVAAKMLEVLGFSVLSASDGRAAVALLREHSARITAVLMDLTMPHLDGEQTFHELRRLNPSLPVLLMSGYNEQDAIGRFVGKGLAGFIQKPFSTSQLHESLYALLG